MLAMMEVLVTAPDSMQRRIPTVISRDSPKSSA
jgi:hypothetical protein